MTLIIGGPETRQPGTFAPASVADGRARADKVLERMDLIITVGPDRVDVRPAPRLFAPKRVPLSIVNGTVDILERPQAPAEQRLWTRCGNCQTLINVCARQWERCDCGTLLWVDE